MNGQAVDLAVTVAGMRWPTPIGLASGTCGYGRELEEKFNMDWSAVGAIFTKGLSLEPRPGNPPDWLGKLPGRMTDVASGAINSIGLENVGIDAFLRDKAGYLARWRERGGGRVFANVLGEKVEEYVELARRLDACDAVDGVELNLSCPNVASGGIEFGQTAEGCTRVTEAVRRVTGKAVIVKLSPLCSVAELAPAAEQAGADALSISNTLPAMVIDPAAPAGGGPAGRAAARGGLSGPALRPVAVRMTYEARRACRLPIIGIGGIGCADDALQFLMAGAVAVQVGTALFANLNVAAEIRADLAGYLAEHGHTGVGAIVGAAHEDA